MSVPKMQLNAAGRAQRRKWRARAITSQTVITIIAVIFVLLAFIPIFLMAFLSLKSPAQFYSNLWAIPESAAMEQL